MKELYTIAEAAKRLKVCYRTALELARRGSLPTVLIGCRRRVPARALDEMICGRSQQQQEAPTPTTK